MIDMISTTTSPLEHDVPAPAGSIRTATVMFTDVVASTSTRTLLGDTAADWRWLTIEHSLASEIAAAGGRVVSFLGDGLLATFEAASSALDAARQVMTATTAAQLRIGIATGDVAFIHPDVLGTPVVIAARLCAAAEPDQILAAELVSRTAGSRTRAQVTSAGVFALKGLPRPIDAVSIRWERPVFDETDANRANEVSA